MMKKKKDTFVRLQHDSICRDRRIWMPALVHEHTATRVGVVRLRNKWSISLGGRNIRLSNHQLSTRTNVEAKYSDARSTGNCQLGLRTVRNSCFTALAIIGASTCRKRSWRMALPRLPILSPQACACE